MPFRNPRHLDLPALQNVADYYDIPLPEERQVTRTTSSNRGGRAGISHGIAAGLERGSAEEVVEAYSVQPRPVRAMNDVVDQLLSAAQLIDLTSDAEQAIAQGAVLQIEGELHLSPVTELGAIMAASLPGLIARAAAGGDMDDVDSGEFGRSILGSLALGDVNQRAIKHVYTIDSDVPDSTICSILDPDLLFGGTEMDDVEGEFTIFGTADRLIHEGRTFSLERYLLPGLNRTLRRAMGRRSIADMLSSFSELAGAQLDIEAINLRGPALVLLPIGIY